MTTPEITPLQIAEYEQLKSEQRTRRSTRDTLIYATLTALGASTAMSLPITNRAGTLTLLMVPLICFALGWTYLRNNHKIAAIGRYLATLNPDSWDTRRLHETGRRRRKIIQLTTDTLLFPSTGMTALALFWAAGPHTTITGLCTLAEIGLLLLLTTEFITHSDILFTRPPNGNADKSPV